MKKTGKVSLISRCLLGITIGSFLILGCGGQDYGQDLEDVNLGTMKQAWNSACKDDECFAWSGDVHSPMTADAYDIAKQLKTIPYPISDQNRVIKYNSFSEFQSPIHFTRNGDLVSSRRYCENAKETIIGMLYQSCYYYNIGRQLGDSHYYDNAKKYFGHALHAVQDSTCPAHTRRYIGNAPNYYRKLMTVCVYGSQQAPIGSCSHDPILDFKNPFNWESREHYNAGVRVSVGLIVGFSKLFGLNGCSFNWGAMRDLFNNISDDYSGYLNCGFLSNTDINCNHPKEVCDGYCVDKNIDEDNCGSCGNRCGGLEECRDGICKGIVQEIECFSNSDCPYNNECIYGECVNTFL